MSNLSLQARYSKSTLQLECFVPHMDSVFDPIVHMIEKSFILLSHNHFLCSLSTVNLVPLLTPKLS